MSKSKDKRIKKFNKKRILPSVFGMCAISLVMGFIVFAIFAIYLVDLVSKKLYDYHDTAAYISDYLISNENDNLDKYIEVNNNIKSIAVYRNNDVLLSTNDHLPDISKTIEFVDTTEMYGNSFEIIIESDADNLFLFDEENVGLTDMIFKDIDFKKLVIDVGEEELKQQKIISCSVWYVFHYKDKDVYILSEISVTQNEMNMIIVSSVLFIAFIAIFVVYHIISVLNLVKSQNRITKVLYTDMITGGNNWLYFIKKGDKLLRKSRGRYRYAVINLRMEKYRSFCTCFGVVEGEELMEKFYNALKKQLNKKELVAYHDEADFGLLITYRTEEELLQRIDELEKLLWSQVPNVKLYFKFGICTADSNDREIDSLYNNATTAIELLPDDSDEKIASYDIEMKKQQLWERKVEDEMDKALVTKQFKLYLQPKYSTKEEKLAGAEALVRWVHPQDGLIPPNKFIPIFENNGFILQLDDYMIEQVAIQQAKWIEEGKELFPISVNVSRAHFTREDLAEHICKIVDKYNVPHKYIELELTESAFFDDKYVLINTVNQLRQNGFIVSMDDFGAGYSSLNSLKELTIDVLKIDADFFRGIDSVDRGMLIVSKVIELAKKLDMKIVAEGIEYKEQVDFLIDQDCDLIQGYYFAKPMSIDEFEEKYN